MLIFENADQQSSQMENSDLNDVDERENSTATKKMKSNQENQHPVLVRSKSHSSVVQISEGIPKARATIQSVHSRAIISSGLSTSHHALSDFPHDENSSLYDHAHIPTLSCSFIICEICGKQYTTKLPENIHKTRHPQ